MRKVFLSVTAVAVAFITGQATGAEKAAVGQKAPDFSLKDQSGKTHRLSDYAGKIVVLEWTNPGCPYVKRHYEAKTMTDLANRYAGRNVVWLAVSTNGNTQANDAFTSQHGISYPILQDSGDVAKAYGAKTTPHMFIIDAKGNLAYAGGIDNDPEGDKGAGRVNYVRKALDELLAGGTVSTPETKSYGCGVKYSK